MKKFSIFLLLISFLLFAKPLEAMSGVSAMPEPKEETSLESLSRQLKRSAERSKEFALSRDTGNFLLFALCFGFLIYLPKHLNNGGPLSRGTIDKVISWPYRKIFEAILSHHCYYEILTLLAGYGCLKTGKPIWDRLTKD